MKTDELESLASKMNLGNILITPEDVTLSMENKGDFKDTFPVPDCDKCAEKCCPPRVAISLFDVARFVDKKLNKLIAGAFEGYVKLLLSDDGGKDVELSRPYMAPAASEPKDCVFLDEHRKCSIYEDRPLICRSYPVAIRIGKDNSKLAVWLGGCRNYEISSDEAAFRRLLNSAVQDYNEKLKSNALLMHFRSQLRDHGFGEYMDDEWGLLTEYNEKNKGMRRQIEDLQSVVDRLRMPQDHVAIAQRAQTDNDWLKERVVNLERELAQQQERAHSIISELTKQLSEHRRLLENLQQSEERNRKAFWKR